MKKVLFATTALVASAGIASAQGIEISGNAEMGVFGGETGGVTTELQFFTDIDVTFTMSGETDNGLTFGASIDLDEAENIGGDDSANGDNAGADGNDNNADNDGFAVFIAGDFGRLTMGDTDGAFDWALADTAGPAGSIADDHTSHPGWNGNGGLDGTYDGQIARYEYSFGDFAFAVSAEIDDTGAGDPVFGIGGTYSGDLGGMTLGVGLGYQSDGTNDVVGISVSGSSANGISGVLSYEDHSNNGNNTFESHIGIGLGYSMDAISVGVNYGVFNGAGGAGDADGFGIAANYDLGGGAVVQFGYGSGNNQAGTDISTYSLGVRMDF